MLADLFPSHTAEDLACALEAHGGDLERTVNYLLASPAPTPAPTPRSTSALAVAVPEGVREDDIFSVVLPGGETVNVRVPPGAMPGSFVRIATTTAAPTPVATSGAALTSPPPAYTAPPLPPAAIAREMDGAVDAAARHVEACETEILTVQRDMTADLGASAAALLWEQVSAALDAEGNASAVGIGTNASRVGSVALLRSAFRARRAAEVEYRSALATRARHAEEANDVLDREEALVLDVLRRRALGGDELDGGVAASVVDGLFGPPAATRHATAIAGWLATRDAALAALRNGADARAALARRRPPGWVRLEVPAAFLRSAEWRVARARARAAAAARRGREHRGAGGRQRRAEHCCGSCAAECHPEHRCCARRRTRGARAVGTHLEQRL